MGLFSPLLKTEIKSGTHSSIQSIHMSINHDSAQKDFFSHKQVVADFLRDYVRQPWVRSVDFDSLEIEFCIT